MIDTRRDIDFDVTGGVKVGNVDLTSSNTLSGYTCALTTFQFTISSALLPNDVSSDKFIWNLGDGTVVKGASATHVYNVPGKYTVSVIGYTSAGQECLSTQTKQLSVSDFLSTRLERDTTDIIDTYFTYIGQLEGRTVNPITINRYTSHQPHNILSSSNYTLNLFASGSNNKRLDVNNYNTDKWAHIGRTWSFFKTVTASDNSVTYAPIESISTTSENLYYRPALKYNENEYYEQVFEKVPVSKINTLTGTVFVGTSGSADVYYADDSATDSDTAVLGFVSLDTTSFPDIRSLYRNKRSDLLKQIRSIYAHSKITIPIRLIPSPATQIDFTSTGIVSMPLSKNKWQMTSIPFFINLADADNVHIDAFPSLSINPAQPGSAPSTDTYTVNLSVVDSTNKLLSANFFKYTDDQLPTSFPGAYRGFFIPVDSADNAKLLGEVKIQNPAGYLKDNLVAWITNAEQSKIFRQTLPGIKFTVNEVSGVLDTSSIDFANIASVGDFFAVSVVPNSAKLNESGITAFIADSTTDNISAYNTYGTFLSSINLNNIKIVSQDGYVDLLTYSYGNSGNLSPSNISLDGDKNIWATLHDAALTCKISDDRVISFIQNTNNVNSGTTNTVEPGIVEADTDNNIWIAYTNTVSGSVVKYNISSTAPSVSVDYKFPAGESPHDMIVDRDNNLWVATVNQKKPVSQTFVDTITAYKTSTGDELVYAFSSSTDISNITKDYIFESQWPVSYKEFTGQFLITSVVSNSAIPHLTVAPYKGRLNQLSTNKIGISATTVKFYPSDKVYKFSSTGTKLLEVSGFYKPGYITVDSEQCPWIAHDSNSVTKIKNGSKYITAKSQTTNFLESTAPTFDLLTFNDSQLGGIAGDTYGNVSVINSFENKITTFNSSSHKLMSSTTINPAATAQSVLYRAYGDWNGFRWINKYMNRSTTAATVTGSATFNIYPNTGKFNIAKQNENFDPADTIKSYRFQPHLLDSDNFFDNFYGQIVGNLSAHPATLGRSLYEKVANFPNNNNDIDTCSVNALYSLCNQFNIPVTNYNYNYIGSLRRVVDLMSIQHKKLWGDRSKFNRDFDKFGSMSAEVGINRGDELSVNTYMVSAGQPIVAEQLFSRQFRVINPMYLSGASTDPGYDSSVGMRNTYPLSSYNPNWGWGLHRTATGVDIANFYNFYEYAPRYSNVQVEGVIDWQNPYTNISESVSGIDVWIEDGGMVDSVIDYELRRGLNLFHSTLSATSSAMQ